MSQKQGRIIIKKINFKKFDKRLSIIFLDIPW
jgi:hypothetical protein